MTDANDNTPRLISRKEAAEYCGLTPTGFSLWVSGNVMPPAIPGTRRWDKRAIDAKLDEISGLIANDNRPGAPCAGDGFEQWEKQRDARKSKGPGEG